MFHWDAVDTSPDLRGQNVLKTFEMMAILHNRRTTRTELERVFCRWTYFRLRSKIFFRPSWEGAIAASYGSTTVGGSYLRLAPHTGVNVTNTIAMSLSILRASIAQVWHICHHLYDASWVMSRNRESIGYCHRPDFRNFLRPSRKIFLSFSQVRR